MLQLVEKYYLYADCLDCLHHWHNVNGLWVPLLSAVSRTTVYPKRQNNDYGIRKQKSSDKFLIDIAP